MCQALALFTRFPFCQFTLVVFYCIALGPLELPKFPSYFITPLSKFDKFAVILIDSQIFLCAKRLRSEASSYSLIR